MQSRAWSIVTSIIKKHVVDPSVLHPLLDLQVDLRLDSLVRIECITNIEKVIGIRFLPNEITSLLSLGDLAELTDQKIRQNQVSLLVPEVAADSSSRFYWKDVLTDTQSLMTELRPLFNRNGITVFLGYLILRVIYVLARVLFRMEVIGSSVLKQLNAPYLICPNHQSYIDPFLISSVLPMAVLSRVIHLGASRYFTGFASSQLARPINVVPIDPDTHLLRAMAAGSAALQANRILNVYPEGRRSFDGELGIFKKGAAILATELNVPIIPVALDGTHRIWPRRSRRIRLAKVKITFGAPIYSSEIRTADITDDQAYERVTAAIRERVCGMLEEMRNK
jgi:long-chain acyl-CoA synthetase